MSNEAITTNIPAYRTLEQFQTVIQRVTTIGETATKIPIVGSTYTPLNYRKGIIVQNVDTSKTVYLGSATVTGDTAATGGLQLLPHGSLPITLDGSCTLYGIVATGDTSAKVVSFEVS